MPHPMLEQEDAKHLISLVRWQALHISEGEPFKLASGKVSPYFFDMKPVILHPAGARIIAGTILRILEYLDINQVGGMESGAIPIVAAVVHASGRSSHPVEGFYVRKQPKERGTMKLIEGNLTPGKKTAILEDVTTTGGMSLRAVEAARKEGCIVENVITILDREEGSASMLEHSGINLISLLSVRDVLPEKVKGGIP